MKEDRNGTRLEAGDRVLASVYNKVYAGKVCTDQRTTKNWEVAVRLTLLPETVILPSERIEIAEPS